MSEFDHDFNKIYFFKSDNEWSLPDKVFESAKWVIPELQIKKQELNKVKGLLGKYKLKVWSKHTANRDRAGFVMKKLSEIIKPELLTQAWCKFYEILAHFPVIPLCAVSNKKLESLHLCEAPGAFVCALNHYLILNYPGLDWSWNAVTLNPNYEGNKLSEMISDDRFIRYTLENWIFGSDFSGDLTKFYNYKHLIELKQDSKISLVTADGSVDCMSNPGEQEKNVERLHFCETVTALTVLQPGGTYVLKIFTMFEESTINLLFLLNCLFEKVAIFKPCTSKSGNSEVYVVNTRFKGLTLLKKIWPKLILAYQNITYFNSNSMFAINAIPQTFLNEVYKCSNFFMKKQVQTILDNIRNFEHKSDDNIYLTKSFISQIFITKYELQPIKDELKIVPNVYVAEKWRIYSSKKYKSLYSINIENITQKRPLTDILKMVIGKELDTVHNSKFTHNDNLKKVHALFGKDKNLSQLYKNTLKVLEKANVVINIFDFKYQSISKFHDQFLKKISSIINDDKNIVLVNIPFITHFLVGLLYVLFFMFDKVYIGNGIVFLYKPKKSIIQNDAKNIFTHILDTQQTSVQSERDFNKAIVQIIPPTLIEYGSFIEKIWNYNNQLFSEDKCFVRPFTHLRTRISFRQEKKNNF